MGGGSSSASYDLLHVGKIETSNSRRVTIDALEREWGTATCSPLIGSPHTDVDLDTPGLWRRATAKIGAAELAQHLTRQPRRGLKVVVVIFGHEEQIQASRELHALHERNRDRRG